MADEAAGGVAASAARAEDVLLGAVDADPDRSRRIVGRFPGLLARKSCAACVVTRVPDPEKNWDSVAEGTSRPRIILGVNVSRMSVRPPEPSRDWNT